MDQYSDSCNQSLPRVTDQLLDQQCRLNGQLESDICQTDPNVSSDLHLSQSKFNCQRDPYVRLIVLPKNVVSNVSDIEVFSEALEQYVFSRDFGKITKRGWWANADQVMIGRSKTSEDVDVNLFSDRHVSYRHCVIRLNTGWRAHKQSDYKFVQFLMGITRHRVSHDVASIIWGYLKPRSRFLIRDIGSSLGTSLKLKSQTLIVPGDVFKIPFNINIKVLKILDPGTLEMEMQSFSNSSVNILGPPEVSYQTSFLVLQVLNKTYMLAGLMNSKYCIGRHQSNDIYINNREVSRKHSTIKYTSVGWSISDGYNQTESKNGTWKDLRTVGEIQQKSNSRWSQIVSGDVILVGDTYFQFESANNQ